MNSYSILCGNFPVQYNQVIGASFAFLPLLSDSRTNLSNSFRMSDDRSLFRRDLPPCHCYIERLRMVFLTCPLDQDSFLSASDDKRRIQFTGFCGIFVVQSCRSVISLSALSWTPFSLSTFSNLKEFSLTDFHHLKILWIWMYFASLRRTRNRWPAALKLRISWCLSPLFFENTFKTILSTPIRKNFWKSVLKR